MIFVRDESEDLHLSVADGLHPAVLLRPKIHVFSVTRVFEHYTTTMPAERLCLICVLIHIQIYDT